MESRISLRSLVASLLLFSSAAWAWEPSKESLYQTSSRWNTSKGDKIQLRELAGKPVLITMVYTKCKYTCPMTVAKLKTIEKALGENTDIRFVLVSFDPKNDTSAELARFVEEKRLDTNRWTVVSGTSSGSVRELAALLDISYKLEKSGEYSHSNVITLLDKEGVKRATLNGIAADHTNLVKSVKELK